MSSVPIEADVGPSRRRATSVDTNGIGSRGTNEPKVIATECVHVRVDDGDRGGGGDHRLDGVAAILQNPEPRL